MSRVTVLVLDRWGRVLVAEEEPGAQPPSGELTAAESPDAGALRIFEAATGTVLDELKLLRPGEARHHIYYCDPDLEITELVPPRGVTLHYVGPNELASRHPSLATEARSLLTKFFASSDYRAMFH